jgi:hypothetical protein
MDLGIEVKISVEGAPRLLQLLARSQRKGGREKRGGPIKCRTYHERDVEAAVAKKWDIIIHYGQ